MNDHQLQKGLYKFNKTIKLKVGVSSGKAESKVITTGLLPNYIRRCYDFMNSSVTKKEEFFPKLIEQSNQIPIESQT